MPNYQINLAKAHPELDHGQLPEPDPAPAPEQPRSFRCRHIKSTGERCGSPALRGEHFCFYHHAARRRPPRAFNHSSDTFTLPLLEDRSAIVHAVAEVLARLTSRSLDRHTAATLLYGLQIASSALPREPRAAIRESSRACASDLDHELVEEIVEDPAEGLIAPVAELLPPEERRPHKSFAAELLDELLATPPTPCPSCGWVRDLTRREHEQLESFERAERGSILSRLNPESPGFDPRIALPAEPAASHTRSGSAATPPAEPAAEPTRLPTLEAVAEETLPLPIHHPHLLPARLRAQNRDSPSHRIAGASSVGNQAKKQWYAEEADKGRRPPDALRQHQPERTRAAQVPNPAAARAASQPQGRITQR